MILAAENCGCEFVNEGPSIVNSPICSGTFLFMVLLQGFLRGRCDIAEPCKRIKSVEDDDDVVYDFIVVGAGSAGSVVAGRLAEDGKFNVLLIEAGGPEPIGARVPSFYRTFSGNKEVDWNYRTVPDADYCQDQGGKGCAWHRGKGLGGSSMLNGMMYHRGHEADYDDWKAEGWSWSDNLEYFYKTEGNRQIGSLVSEKYHSGSGPLPVQQFNDQPPVVYDLLSAINETGLPVIADINDPNTPDGFAIAQAYNDNGQRYTTFRAFIESISHQSNIKVKTYAQTTKVVFDGKRAVGVEYVDLKTGKTRIARADKEVILSAGSLNTPHILLHSGVGPKETLDRFKIPVKADLPVGQNLRNHIGVTIYFKLGAVKDTFTLDWAKATEYLLTRQGPMSSTGATQLTGLLYSSYVDQSHRQPDLQFFFNGFYADCSRTGQPGECASDPPQQEMGVSANAVNLLPKSVGYVTLNSSDPLDPPVFHANYFGHPGDIEVVKEGVLILKKISESQTMQEKYKPKLDSEHSWPCDDKHEQWSDRWLECIIKLCTDPQNHQVGTAAINEVVDTKLRVKHLEGLSVMDASVIPTLVTGNPQGAIMMVAERGAAEILDLYRRR